MEKNNFVDGVINNVNSMIANKMTILDSFILYSRNPLYYIDDNEDVVKLENIYSDKECILIKLNKYDSINLPLGKTVTICPYTGTIFFDSLESVKKFNSIYRVDYDTFIKNSKTFSRLCKSNQRITTINNDEIKSGIYSLKTMDMELINEGTKDLCYIDSDNKIRSVVVLDDEALKDPLLNYISDYIEMTPQIGRIVDILNERLIFEVYVEGKNTVYINYWTIPSISIYCGGSLYCSHLLNYPIFFNKQTAALFLMDTKMYNDDEIENRIREDSFRYYNTIVKQSMKGKQMGLTTFIRVLEFIWNWKLNDKITKFVKGKFDEIIKKIKPGDEEGSSTFSDEFTSIISTVMS